MRGLSATGVRARMRPTNPRLDDMLGVIREHEKTSANNDDEKADAKSDDS